METKKIYITELSRNFEYEVGGYEYYNHFVYISCENPALKSIWNFMFKFDVENKLLSVRSKEFINELIVNKLNKKYELNNSYFLFENKDNKYSAYISKYLLQIVEK
jgi:hypothetical protein